ncbi:DUF4166 domain-containing protein [Aureimonas sp. SK2]|uniref:DUF4166 domain-containing protein n=1 Tax=Aureimonas sp. SK2 TaxID=3015992 RepID=UPI002443AD70|nr:DUF4166 domain-containing protein [Aureimonas sp. SK2]
MGSALGSLPPQVQAFHEGVGVRRWAGVCDVRRGGGAPARMLATLFGFPRAGLRVPICVTVTPHRHGEMWTRNFGGQVLRSFQWAGDRGSSPLLFERFGPVRVGSRLIPDGERLRILPQKGSIFGLPIPRALLPSGEAFEAEREGCFSFDVSINLPLIGLLVAYTGALTPWDDGHESGREAVDFPSEARAMRSQDAGRVLTNRLPAP